MGIEPTREALPGLENKRFAAMADTKCDQRVNFRGMWGHVGLRRDTSICEVPGSSLSVVGLRSGQERTPARGYGRLIRSKRRSRMHPVLLQKIYEGAHLRQEQAVAQG
jgi:hypothetical protein